MRPKRAGAGHTGPSSGSCCSGATEFVLRYSGWWVVTTPGSSSHATCCTLILRWPSPAGSLPSGVRLWGEMGKAHAPCAHAVGAINEPPKRDRRAAGEGGKAPSLRAPRGGVNKRAEKKGGGGGGRGTPSLSPSAGGGE